MPLRPRTSGLRPPFSTRPLVPEHARFSHEQLDRAQRRGLLRALGLGAEAVIELAQLFVHLVEDAPEPCHLLAEEQAEVRVVAAVLDGAVEVREARAERLVEGA